METEWEFIVEENDTEYYCIICGCDICGIHNVEKHCRGKRHDDALDKYGGNILPDGHNQYYCDLCDCRVSGYSNVRGHLTGQRHEDALEDSESESETSEDSVQWDAMETEEFLHCSTDAPDKYTCFLCNKGFSKHLDATIHLNLRDHKEAFRVYGSEILCNDNQYYCQLCDCYMTSWKNVHAHLYGDRHDNNM